MRCRQREGSDQSMTKNVFCFWEPAGEIPAYLDLCIQTWRRAFAGFNIIHLNHSNLRDYVSSAALPWQTLRRLTLSQQKDAISIAVLKKHGGIFMDADTIAVCEPSWILKTLEQAEVVLFGYHLGFVAARRNSNFLSRWLSQIQARLALLDGLEFSPEDVPWDYTGYESFQEVIDQLAGIDRQPAVQLADDAAAPWAVRLKARTKVQRLRCRILLSTVLKRRIRMLDRCRCGFIVEAVANPASCRNPKDAYRDFWFSKAASLDRVFSKKQTVIGLHNSWTPDWFLNLSKEEVLEHECMLSKTLRHLLQANRAA